MSKSATFLFHENLNDFLSADKKQKHIIYPFFGTPTVKDAIEAIGVPHPEVDVILLNGVPVDFAAPLLAQDQVEVFPASVKTEWSASNSLQSRLPFSDKFVLDVHLGKLAKGLRMLGCDAWYQNYYDDATIARIAAQENRIVLTRDIALLKNKVIHRGYWLRSQHLEEQLREVILYFHLQHSFRPFTRCLECNVAINPVPKEAVLEKLPPNTRLYFEEFYQCPSCERVYWKGSHYERMQEFIQRFNAGDIGEG